MKKILFLALLGACSKDNPYYCESAPDHNCARARRHGELRERSERCAAGATPVCARASVSCLRRA